MKHHPQLLTAAFLSITLLSARAQRPGMGGPPPGPNFGAEMAKIFGDNSAFSATMEMHMTGGADGGEVVMQGKMAFQDGKSRFEMDLSQMKNSKMPPQAATQMKQMGMDKMAAISRPDKSVSYLVYPGLQAYVENPSQNASAPKSPSDFKVDATEQGKESVEGHDCVKNKVTVTDSAGKASEFTVWNASDLKKFPIKIVTEQNGNTMTMIFKDVRLSAPDASQFDPPTAYKKYDNMMSLMQTEMMKHMGGGRGMPPGQ
jgi:hypothetical protein